MTWLHKQLLVVPASMGAFLAGLFIANAPARGDEWFQDQAVRPPTTQPGGREMPPPVGPPPVMAGQPNAGPQSDFPDDQVHDWVAASARAARARAIFRRVESELDQAVRDAQWTFEHSREYKDAVAAETLAYDAYTAERRKALESVIQDPKYLAALKLRDELADQIVRTRAMSRPRDVPRELLLTLASQKLQYATDAHSLEIAALDKDDALKTARQKMVQASARVSELRAQLDDSIHNNPRIVQARRAIEDARIALITAEAYYAAASIAGGQAVDYAYYRHRWDNLRQNNAWVSDAWGPYGMGFRY